MDGINALSQAQSTFFYVFISIFRYLAPIMVAVILFRCVKPLLTFRRQPEIWAWLCIKDGDKFPITHWENVIGRSKRSDVVIDAPTISKNHAVLTRYDDGSWTITDADSKEGVLVNHKRIRIRALRPDDIITIGGIEMTLQPVSAQQEHKAQHRATVPTIGKSFVTILLLTVFQTLCCLAFLLGGQTAYAQSILLGEQRNIHHRIDQCRDQHQHPIVADLCVQGHVQALNTVKQQHHLRKECRKHW